MLAAASSTAITTGGGMIGFAAARASSAVYITIGKSEDEGQQRKRGYKQ